MSRTATIVFIATLLLTAKSSVAQNTYYLDSRLGNDRNSGLSKDKSFASLQRVNQITFKPGDKLMIKSGTSYIGQLKPGGSGNFERPIIIDRYGDGVKPVLNGLGKTKAAVLLENVQYWEISNIEITNSGAERASGRTGISILAHNFGECHHIYLKNLSIHDVNGSLIKDEGAGSAIFWHNSGDDKPSRFVDLRIENCHLYNCERNGIISWGYTDRNNWFPSIGVVIRENLLEKIPGDGIVPVGCDGALIEYNVMRDSPDILSHEEAAAGIWPWSSDNTVIQYNEVSGHKAKWDGQGFDSDWNCKNTLIQYNYSHDNNGGFILICNNGESIDTHTNHGTEGTIVRYNVSVNDGLRSYPTERAGFFSPVFHITGPCRNTQIYNNVIFVKKKLSREIDRTLIKMENWGGPWPQNTVFKNNIFYSLDSTHFSFGRDSATIFQHNVFFGSIRNVPNDMDAIFSDPLFKHIPKDAVSYKLLTCFQLRDDSPCIDSGAATGTNGTLDFFGHAVANDRIDRGIAEVHK